MSCSCLYKVFQDSPIELVGEFGNSWGFAMRIWNSLAIKYMKLECFPLHELLKPNEESLCSKFWKLASDKNVPLRDRIVLASTYDRVIIEKERLADLADCYDEFEKEYAYAGVTNLPAIAKVLRELQNEDGFVGVVFHVNSVTENLWETYNEEKDEYVSFMFKDFDEEKHFLLFEELENVH